MQFIAIHEGKCFMRFPFIFHKNVILFTLVLMSKRINNRKKSKKPKIGISFLFLLLMPYSSFSVSKVVCQDTLRQIPISARRISRDVPP